MRSAFSSLLFSSLLFSMGSFPLVQARASEAPKSIRLHQPARTAGAEALGIDRYSIEIDTVAGITRVEMQRRRGESIGELILSNPVLVDPMESPVGTADIIFGGGFVQLEYEVVVGGNTFDVQGALNGEPYSLAFEIVEGKPVLRDALVPVLMGDDLKALEALWVVSLDLLEFPLMGPGTGPQFSCLGCSIRAAGIALLGGACGGSIVWAALTGGLASPAALAACGALAAEFGSFLDDCTGACG